MSAYDPLRTFSPCRITRRMELPRVTLREFRKELWEAHPRWAKLYLWSVGLPAWTVLAYRSVTGDAMMDGAIDKVALGSFLSAVLVQMAVLFRGFWRNDL